MSDKEEVKVEPEVVAEDSSIAAFSNFYEVDVDCRNCRFDGEVKIPRGTPIADHFCPNCGCKSLFLHPVTI